MIPLGEKHLRRMVAECRSTPKIAGGGQASQLF